MEKKEVGINEVKNGYIVTIDGEEEHVFEKGNELELLQVICEWFGWKDVIDFTVTEDSSFLTTEKGGSTKEVSEVDDETGV